jgi:hypothetical protein
MMEWLTLKWSATLLWLKPPLCMPTACHLSGMVNFRRTIPNQCPRAGRSRKTTPREDRLISRRARQRPFSTAGNLAFGGHISTRTVIRRLHDQGMRTRRPIKRPQWTHIVMVFLACQITIKNASNLQSKEKQPQTVTPPSPNAVVPTL